MSSIRALLAICSAVVAFGASAQQPQQPNPMDVVPDKMPNDIPYGTPISLAQAQAAISAAVAESNKRGWKLNVAVVDSGANLVAFARMDGAQLGSIAISEHKARAAAKFRRETKAFEAGGPGRHKYPPSPRRLVAPPGGRPLAPKRPHLRPLPLARRHRPARHEL